MTSYRSFSRFANRTAVLSGNDVTFLLALWVIIVWAITGPLLTFSDTWQLVINTSTAIVTFLMVFLIQNTQNRDALAVHLKLGEIIKSIDAADNEIIRAEDETDEQLSELNKEVCRSLQRARGAQGAPRAAGLRRNCSERQSNRATI